MPLDAPPPSSYISKKSYQYLGIFILVESLLAVLLLLNTGKYGNLLFFLLPLTFGVLIGFFQSKESFSLFKVLSLVVLAAFSLIGLVSFMRIEGLICGLMALGYIVFPMGLGVIFGYWFLEMGATKNPSVYIVLLGLQPLVYGYDHWTKNYYESSVENKITVNMPVDSVWNTMTRPIELDANIHWLFQWGVSYPKNMQVVNKNGSYYLSCSTNNEPIIDLAITAMKPNELLSFEPTKDPVSMRETAIVGGNIHAAHLEGYLKIKKGEFRLVRIDATTTQIIAHTEYSYRITPAWYWELWSDFILSKMHQQVLKSIAKKLEN